MRIGGYRIQSGGVQWWRGIETTRASLERDTNTAQHPVPYMPSSRIMVLKRSTLCFEVAQLENTPQECGLPANVIFAKTAPFIRQELNKIFAPKERL